MGQEQDDLAQVWAELTNTWTEERLRSVREGEFAKMREERDAALARAERAEASLAGVQVVYVVFQGGGPDLRFVEVETPDGQGLGAASLGAQWVRHVTYPEWPCLRLRVLPEGGR